MKYPIFSVKDNKVGFMNPQMDTNEQTAVRGFAFGINNADNVMNFVPSDFDLYKVGYFDTEKGTLESITPDLIVSGSSVYGAK